MMLLVDSYGGFLDNPSFSFELVGMRGHLPPDWPNLGFADPPLAHSGTGSRGDEARGSSGINKLRLPRGV